MVSVKKNNKIEPQIFKGIGVSPGIAIGPVVVLRNENVIVAHCFLEPKRAEKELERLDKAVGKSKEQLETIREKIAKEVNLDHAFIFDAQLLMLEDEAFYGLVKDLIIKERINAEWAVEKVTRKYLDAFHNIEVKYIKERSYDIRDISRRVVKNLGDESASDLHEIQQPSIVVARDLPPSDLGIFQQDKILGFATEIGGKTSHVSLLARSMELPAVVALHEVVEQIDTGDMAILDGEEEVLIINPTENQLDEYRNKLELLQKVERQLIKNREFPAITKDGFEVTLLANIDLPIEVQSALEHGAKGIGLFRSEFMFIQNPEKIKDEEVHYNIYSSIIKDASPFPSTIRIMDIGNDKFLSHQTNHKEPNPALGLRAIRFFLKNKDTIYSQIHGMLRASVHGKLEILIPFVSGITEVYQTLELINEVKDDLRQKKIPFSDDIRIGVMIEIPSAALVADQLAKWVDFFSVGTNDLIQYTLAIDRANENVTYLYRPLHPAIVKLLAIIVKAGKEAGIPVAVCGEIAADPISMIVLLGMRYEVLSMNAASIPIIKNVIRSMTVKEAERIVSAIIDMTTAKETEEYILEKLTAKFPAGFPTWKS
jgi:phosphotransferase system enzyme I (PtsI)